MLVSVNAWVGACDFSFMMKENKGTQKRVQAYFLASVRHGHPQDSKRFLKYMLSPAQQAAAPTKRTKSVCFKPSGKAALFVKRRRKNRGEGKSRNFAQQGREYRDQEL